MLHIERTCIFNNNIVPPYGYAPKHKVCKQMKALEGGRDSGAWFYQENATVLVEKMGGKRCSKEPNLPGRAPGPRRLGDNIRTSHHKNLRLAFGRSTQENYCDHTIFHK
jgi:hypothetical protein